MFRDKVRLVIDACVAQSAGDEKPTAAEACNCRDMLLEVYKNKHKMVLTDFIIDEWNRHQSRWSFTWRTEMYKSSFFEYVRDCADGPLWQKIVLDMKNPFEVEQRHKDFGYIEAALVTDRTLISSDRKSRNAYSTIARTVTELRDIVYVNPCEPNDSPIGWIRNGAPSDDWRRLGF